MQSKRPAGIDIRQIGRQDPPAGSASRADRGERDAAFGGQLARRRRCLHATFRRDRQQVRRIDCDLCSVRGRAGTVVTTGVDFVDAADFP